MSTHGSATAPAPTVEDGIAAAVAAREQGRAADALDLLDRAARHWPAHADVHFQRGYTLRQLARHDEALAAYETVLRLQPRSPAALANCGNTLAMLGRPEQAADSYRRALAQDPAHPVALHGLGVLLLQSDDPREALPYLERAVRAAPADRRARLHLGLARLQQGDYERGLQDYEQRWVAVPPAFVPRFPQPPWLGRQPLQGKTILLTAEQGFGDTLQFCRYAPLVRAHGARVVLEAQAALLPVLRTLQGVDLLVARGSVPAFDLYCPQGSLPLAFGTRPGSIPWSGAYLRADPAAVERWRPRLARHAGLRIGIAWSGNRTHAQDAARSIPLATLLRHLPAGPTYVSLQPDVRDDDRAALAARGDVVHFGEQLRDFGDTAALCELVHVVVSVDTSVAHLAGALGRDLRLLLPAAPDWRWLLEREDSPWYPRARLYRQRRGGDWAGPLERLAAHLFPPTPSTASTPC